MLTTPPQDTLETFSCVKLSNGNYLFQWHMCHLVVSDHSDTKTNLKAIHMSILFHFIISNLIVSNCYESMHNWDIHISSTRKKPKKEIHIWTGCLAILFLSCIMHGSNLCCACTKVIRAFQTQLNNCLWPYMQIWWNWVLCLFTI